MRTCEHHGVKAPPFRYHRPDTLAEALALLAEHGDDAKVLAGGQSLVPLMAMRMGRPAVVVDIGRVPGLAAIEVGADGRAPSARWSGTRPPSVPPMSPPTRRSSTGRCP